MSIEEEAQAKQKQNNKNKLIAIISSIVALIIIIGVGIGWYNHHQKVIAHEKAVAAALKLKQEKEKYLNDIRDVSLSMGTSSVRAEKMLNGYSNSWHDVIFNDSVKIGDKTATTIDEAIADQSSEYDDSGDNSGLQDEQNKIESKIKDLNNPPSGEKEYYNLILNLYDDYSQFAGLALNPSGSYNSFSDQFNKLDNQIVKDQSDLEIRLPKVK